MHSRTEMADHPIVPTDTASIRRTSARALRLGRRLKLAGLEIADLNQAEPITTSPLVLRLGSGGLVALFAYGAAVFIGVSQTEEEAFLQKLGDRIEGRLDAPAVVVSEIEIGTSGRISDDFIVVHDLSPPCLVIVADALAKNVALAFEEGTPQARDARGVQERQRSARLSQQEILESAAHFYLCFFKKLDILF